jgi:hypothetical protein
MDEFNTYKGKAYRFISIEAFKATINSNFLRFTRPDQFNDPLDCSPYLAPYPWKRWKTAGRNFLDETRSETFERVFKFMYVCCFSQHYKSEDCYLMWSHYAKNHTQLCFEFDFEINPYLGNPSIVSYPDSLIEARQNSTNRNQRGMFMMTNKLNVWNYEREVRLIIDILHPQFHKLNVNFDTDKKHLDIKFDPRLITKVIFGVNCLQENQTEIIDLLNKYHLTPVIERMMIDPETILLDSEQL